MDRTETIEKATPAAEITESEFWDYVKVRAEEIRKEKEGAPEWKQSELEGEVNCLVKLSRRFFRSR